MFGAAQAEIEGSVHVGLNSEYIWRGIDQSGGNTSDSMTEAGIDLSLGALAGWDFEAGIWYASGNGNTGFADEVDYYASASRAFGCGVTASIGYIYYDFPSVPGPDVLNQELSFGLSTEFSGFSIGLTHFWAIDGDNDGYTELTLDRSFELCSKTSLDLGATVSYDIETSDVHHYGLSAVVNYAFNDVLTISPYVSATFAQDGAENGVLSISGNEDDELFGGVIVSAAF
ncbi:MAG: hypothetical protein O3A92_09415 [Verrucomicrobia bacterium]|nr:hypothetical protein [Verrucomicrobiota bacterium]